MLNRNGDPICNEIPLSNNCNKITINKQSLSNVNNQTINIDYDYEETTDLIEINSNNLNVTINIQQQQQQQQTEIKNKLNITVNIDDLLDNDLPLAASTTTTTTTETTTKEKLNVTIEIKEKKLKSIENEQIPKTLDLFTQDLNKQSSSSHSPNVLSSSSSSSCSSLSSSCSFSKHNNNNNNNKNYTGRLPVSSKLANYKSTNLRILTSSVDKDLNKMTTNAELPKPSTINKTVSRTVTHGLPQSVRTSSIPSGIKTAITSTATTNNNKRKSMIKKSGLPVSPSSNINNVTIDIGDENKLTRTSSIAGSKKITHLDLFNDIEASNIIQPIQLHNAFAQTSIPKSFDMFANDINKQTIIQLPS